MICSLNEFPTTRVREGDILSSPRGHYNDAAQACTGDSRSRTIRGIASRSIAPGVVSESGSCRTASDERRTTIVGRTLRTVFPFYSNLHPLAALLMTDALNPSLAPSAPLPARSSSRPYASVAFRVYLNERTRAIPPTALQRHQTCARLLRYCCTPLLIAIFHSRITILVVQYLFPYVWLIIVSRTSQWDSAQRAAHVITEASLPDL
jgi:hypothetical protein